MRTTTHDADSDVSHTRRDGLLEESERIGLIADPLLAGPLADLAREQLGFLTTAQIRALGVSRRSVQERLEARSWRRAARGILDVAADGPELLPPGTRKKRAAVLALLAYGPDAIAVGLTALTLLDVWGVPIGRPAQVSLPGASQRGARSGLVCRRFERGVRPIVVHGLRVVPPVVALAQGICEVSPRTALALLESALHRKIIRADQLAEVREATRRRRGCRRLQVVWPLVDARRESPAESGAWFDLWEINLEPTDVQIEIRTDQDVLVARPDFGYQFEDGSWLFVEIDGEEAHPTGNEHDPARDARLQEHLARRGVESEVRRFRSSQLGSQGEMTGVLKQVIDGRRWRRRRRPRELE